MTIRQLQHIRPLVNLAELARRAGIKEQTLFAKVRRGTDLTREESVSVDRVLQDGGISVTVRT